MTSLQSVLLLDKTGIGVNSIPSKSVTLTDIATISNSRSVKFFVKKYCQNKNAFQWGAYRPLVYHVPTCTAQGGDVSQCALGRRGVCPACTGQREGVCLVVSARGVCLCLPGGCLPGRGVSVQGVCMPREEGYGRHPSGTRGSYHPCEQND